MENTHLGKSSPYIDTYSPELLVAIERAPIRNQLGINTTKMKGIDIWNHWEVSYLSSTGKPEIACLSLTYDGMSPCIVESKSLKLYFNSLNQAKFSSTNELLNTVTTDIEATVKSSVKVEVLNDSCLQTDWINDYLCLDDIEAEFCDYSPAPDYLAVTDAIVTEKLYSHLFKTNCMVTGQPDWASVFIEYKGNQIDRVGLLKYLVSFRNHQAFHEPSCEMIFSDLLERCQLEQLSVYCRYTRRGGIDINPYRSTQSSVPHNYRILRQ